MHLWKFLWLLVWWHWNFQPMLEIHLTSPLLIPMVCTSKRICLQIYYREKAWWNIAKILLIWKQLSLISNHNLSIFFWSQDQYVIIQLFHFLIVMSTNHNFSIKIDLKFNYLSIYFSNLLSYLIMIARNLNQAFSVVGIWIKYKYKLVPAIPIQMSIT